MLCIHRYVYISPETWNIQDIIHRPKEAQEEGRPKYEYFVLPRRGSKIPMGGDTETKCGTKPERKAVQRLPHLGIHPIYITQTLMWIPTSAC